MEGASQPRIAPLNFWCGSGQRVEAPGHICSLSATFQTTVFMDLDKKKKQVNLGGCYLKGEWWALAEVCNLLPF